MLKNYQRNWKQIMAIIPYYRNERQTSAEIWYENGMHETVQTRCEKIVSDIAQYLNLDIQAIQQKASVWIEGQYQRKLPIILDKQHCLLVLKCREERGRNTGTLGYVALHAIHYVLGLPDNGTRIIFQHGQEPLDIPQRRRTVTSKIDTGWRILTCYFDEGGRQEQSGLAEPYSARASFGK